MSEDSLTSTDPQGQLRRACAEMGRALRRGDGGAAEALALELIYNEFVVRGELGQSPSIEEWYGRFPERRERLERLHGYLRRRVKRLYDPDTGAVKRTLVGQSLDANAVAASPNGRTLASAGRDRQVRLWDLATSQERLRLAGHTATVQALAFAPGGKRLASAAYHAGYDGEVLLGEAD